MPRTRPLRREDPRELGGYRLKGLLGFGGQGTVYHGVARDGTEVAIKLLHPQFADDENTRRWLAHEFEVAGSVVGHTAKVMHSGVFNGCPYIVSEYIEGPTLAERVDDDGPFTPEGLRRLAAETIAAIVAIHAVGIMHCDFKPGNILLGPDGPRVIDFGIAHALNTLSTRAGVGVGTPAYMAPEQINHQHRIGPHTDIFAWASTMVFAACGHPAFGMDEYQRDVMHHIITDEPDLSGVPEPLRELLYDCFAKDPANRPSATEVRDRLRRGPGAMVPLPFGVPSGPELAGHTGTVYAIALTTAGDRPFAVSASHDRTARVWDLVEGRQHGPPLHHATSVFSVVCGAIGTTPVVATGAHDGSLHVWDLDTGRPVGPALTGHTGAVSALAFQLIDGAPIVVSVGTDRTLRMWNIAEGRQVGAPLAANTAIQSLAVAELDGVPVLLAGGTHDRQVRLWSLRDRTQLPQVLNGHRDVIKAVATGRLQHGPVAVTCGSESVMVWDLANPGRQVTKLRHGSAVIGASAAVTGTRSVLLTSGRDQRVLLWDLSTGDRIGPPLVEGRRHSPPFVVALGTVEGRMTAITSGPSPSLQMWSLGRPYLLPS